MDVEKYLKNESYNEQPAKANVLTSSHDTRFQAETVAQCSNSEEQPSEVSEISSQQDAVFQDEAVDESSNGEKQPTEATVSNSSDEARIRAETLAQSSNDERKLAEAILSHSPNDTRFNAGTVTHGSEEDIYEYNEEENKPVKAPTLQRGRKRKREVKEKSERFCPWRGCRRVESTNFSRHLKSHTKDPKRLASLSEEASFITRAGVRKFKRSDVPSFILEEIKDLNKKEAFLNFCCSIGAKLSEDQEESDMDEQMPQKRKIAKKLHHSESSAPEDEEDEGDEEIFSDSTTTSKSAKTLMKEQGFPLLPMSHSLMELFKSRKTEEIKRGNDERPDLVNQLTLKLQRILGYAKMYLPTENEFGDLAVLLNATKIIEYIDYCRVNSGLSTNSARNYFDAILWAIKTVQSHGHEHPHYPHTSEKRIQLEDKLKSTKNQLVDAHKKIKEKVDQEIIQSQEDFGKNLPDVNHWHSYFTDAQVLAKAEESLSHLEKLSDDQFLEFERNPVNSPSVEAFNFISSFLAAKQLTSCAARRGELENVTLSEFNERRAVPEGWLLTVSKHKTSKMGKATILVKTNDIPMFDRYHKILMRFSKKPSLAFPKLGRSGFKKNVTILYHLNKWLKTQGFPLFTCNQLRKVTETVNEEQDDETRALVSSGLNHGPKPVKKYYNAPTAKKALKSKTAVINLIEQTKLERKLQAIPPEFPVSIYDGPFTEDELKAFSKETWHINHFSEGMYKLYKDKWAEQAWPHFANDFVTSVRNDELKYEDLTEVLDSMPIYENVRTKIVKEVQHILGLAVRF